MWLGDDMRRASGLEYGMNAGRLNGVLVKMFSASNGSKKPGQQVRKHSKLIETRNTDFDLSPQEMVQVGQLYSPPNSERSA